MHEAAKSHERWWARYFGGLRHPSQGFSHPDVSGLWFTLEHKYRQFRQYSAEFRKAIAQHDENLVSNPSKIPFIGLSLSEGRGKPIRRFLIYEVKENSFEETWRKLDDAKRITGQD